MRVFQEGREGNLCCKLSTLAIAVVAHNYGREESERIFRKVSLFDLIVGDDSS